MTPLLYAGVGSRTTPRDVLETMTVMAAWLGRRGWHLHTGWGCGGRLRIPGRRPTRHAHPVPAVAGIIAVTRARDYRTLVDDPARRCLTVATALHVATQTDGVGNLPYTMSLLRAQPVDRTNSSRRPAGKGAKRPQAGG